MNITVFDTETTGLPAWNIPSEDPAQPHIVQLGVILLDDETQEEKAVIDTIIKPDGWVIPAEVTAIHGITTERAMDEGIPEKQAVEMFLDLWRQSKLRVAHNVTFDDRIIRIALKRFFTDELADAFRVSPKACTGLLAKPIMKMEPKNRYGYKMPKLSEAYKHFTGRDLEDAHTAIADVRACRDVYLALQALKDAA